MRALRPHRLSRARFGWLLWLALLLPVAQYAAALHGLSHAVQQAQGEDKQAAHFAHCDLCVTAAEVAAGALPSLPPTLQLPALHHAPLRTLARQVARSSAPLPY